MSETYPGQMLPELQEKTTVDSNDLFYMVSSNASKKIKGSNLKAQMKPSDYTGATSSTNGANGLVPQPTTSDVDRFLKGDGTWGDISYAVGEASGSIATFSDGSPLPMRSLKAYIEPVQDLHGYDAPWVGGAGKNKLNCTRETGERSAGGGTITTYADGTIKLSGNFTDSLNFTYCSNLSLKSGSYILNGGTEGCSITISNVGTAYGNTPYNFTLNEDYSGSVSIYMSSGQKNITLKPMIRLASVTDSTFAPYSNECPIIGFTEANVNRAKVYQICEPSDSTEVTANGVTMTYLGKGKYRVKGTPTANEYTALNIPIVPFTIYGGDDAYIKINNSVGLSNATLIFNNGTSQIDSWGLYPSNRSGTYVGMRNKYTNNITIAISSSGYGTNFDFTFKVEILSNSTANLNTYTIQFTDGSNPLTVYGGYVDVVSGLLVVDRVYIDLGSIYYYIVDSGVYGATLSNVKAPSSNYGVANAICSNYPIVAREGQSDKTIAINKNGRAIISDSTYVGYSESDFQTAMNGVQLVYELATPQTYQLTAQQVKSLLGENRVWADTGDVDAHYVRDLTITIDDILSRLEALEG